ncbi:MAG: NADH:ubiquinone reductase (Na(+)-transporting) subunit A [Leptothrix sp. (in: Bacteria)]|nr:NADH:ubiquinone reductase (Na(+)-transporting) subunit A [Leptothrix sp. (in: b-proteobacteria)]
MHRVKRGLDLPLAGAPVQTVEPARDCMQVALIGADYPGLKPTFHVQPGDRVQRGQLLFNDKQAPGVRFTAPASGTVSALHRGEYRAFQSLVIDVDGDDDAAAGPPPFAAFKGTPPAALDDAEVRALLVESGLWTALRTRPYSKVPRLDTTPRALFITATDTRPHAPAVNTVLAGRHDDFRAGVAALSQLASGPTVVCVGPGFDVDLPALPRVSVDIFEGPHPAGNAGTHIHMLYPVDHERCVWHVGYQDVAAIGRLFTTGRLDVERVVSLAGPGVLRPRLLRTRLGASVDVLTQGEIAPGALRIVSGSVLDGRTASGPVHGWLGRHHLQITALAEAVEREFLGWIMPGTDKFSIWGVVAGAWMRRPRLALNTTTNGGARAMVPIGAFERVMPLDLMPTFLLRALLMKDDERAEALGALELDEDDLALCTFVCPGKAEYGPLLRAALARIEKEVA